MEMKSGRADGNGRAVECWSGGAVQWWRALARWRGVALWRALGLFRAVER